MIGEQDINRSQIVNEVRTAFTDYEDALRCDDVARLNDWFLARADTVRFGIAEHNYGAAAIAAWRARAPAIAPGRQLDKVVITTFGDDVASVCAEFSTPPGARRGRQSQLWVRGNAGWRIAAAHVSEIDARYLTADCDAV